MPRKTARKKIEQIEFYGGKAHFVDSPAAIYDESRRLAKELNGHYMDQFTYAERATDWRGNNNIANSIFDQMKLERFPVPSWIVMSPGTGGTSATIGRYIRYQMQPTQLCVVDPENSVFHDYFMQRDNTITGNTGSRIEGIGRPRVEPSFIPDVIDEMRKIPDAASVATVHWLERIIGRKAGASTGTNLFGVLQIAAEMKARGETGSIVTLLCDSGERYLDTYYNAEWIEENIGDLSAYTEKLEQLEHSGQWQAPFNQTLKEQPLGEVSHSASPSFLNLCLCCVELRKYKHCLSLTFRYSDSHFAVLYVRLFFTCYSTLYLLCTFRAETTRSKTLHNSVAGLA